MKKTALVIMAAGIGSRFGGGIKQLAPVGPGGEIIMDYSIHDAMEAGFDKVIFIIRKDLEKDFKEIIGNRIEKLIPVEYAYQEIGNLPEGYEVTPGRTKPWGTGQAVLTIKGMVDCPFLVINADDYYGKEGFCRIHDYMVNEMDESSDIYDICMGGFVLANTLSENGAVTRGVCQVEEGGILKTVTHTAGNSPVLAQGIGKHKAAHADIINIRGLIHLIYHVIMDTAKALLSVIIICIDHKEGAVHHSLDGQHGLACSPGLRASWCHLIALRKIADLLIGIFHRDQLLDPVADDLLKILFQVLSDNEYDLVKSGLHCIVNGVVHNDLTARAHRRQLLDSSAKTAADSGCHDH